MKNNPVFALLLLFSLLISCNLESQNWGTGIKGEGPKVTKTIELPAFDGLALAISGNVYLRQGSPQSVKVEAQQNILDILSREVKDGVWKIKFDKNVRNYEDIKIWVTIPELTEVAVSGSGSVKGENTFTGVGELQLAVSGSGNIHLDASSKSLEAAISGSGNMELGGSTGDCSMRISGSGDISAFDLQSNSCSVRISGSGDASVNAKEDLEVAIAGSGDVYYKGDARVKSKISGSGNVISK
ncbi:MAG: DUF2807 domain-containing protein [Lewinellaceae bacterium]|nr:DUF2807 domain-containing protein [Saprospiraceae bacterium]MCB9340935.1 DUF2807 domain-containing protein [Lewinellaceae bacterium]